MKYRQTPLFSPQTLALMLLVGPLMAACSEPATTVYPTYNVDGQTSADTERSGDGTVAPDVQTPPDAIAEPEGDSIADTSGPEEDTEVAEQDTAEPEDIEVTPEPEDATTDVAEPQDAAPLSDSCEGICGEQAPSGCWCDTGCSGRGDCCDDIAEHCETTPPPPNECDEADDCEAGGPCDVAACDAGTCVYTPALGSCDDGDPCTDDDVCGMNGVCLGEPKVCDDGIGCTADSCNNGSCIHAPIGSSCELNLSITFPSRGASLTGSSSVTVTGMVDTPLGLQSLTISGQEVDVEEDGYFEMVYPAEHGLNLIEAELIDGGNNSMMVNQSFLYASSYHSTGSPANVTTISAGSGAWFASTIFDDGDLSDLDDLKALAWLILNSFDLADVIPSPLLEGDDAPGFLQCTWEVTVSNVQYTLKDINLEPGYDQLEFGVVYENISADIAAVAPAFGCPDADGDVKVDDVSVTAMLEPKVINNNIVIDIASTDVQVAEPEVTLNGITGFLLNWVVNFFEDDMGMMIEEEITNIIQTEIAPLIKSALNQVSDFDLDFTLPGFNGTPDAQLSLVAQPKSLSMEPTGLDLEINLGVAAPSVISHASPGSIARSPSCGNLSDPIDSLPHANAIEAFALEDFFNQLLFTSWRAGQMQFSLNQTQFGDVGANIGLDDMTITLDPHLPPVVTTCDTGPTAPLELQLGDVLIDADFSMLGVQQTVSLYLSLKIDLWLELVGSQAGEAQVVASVGEVKAISVHLMSSDTSDIVELFLDEEFLESVMLDAFVGGFLSDIWSAIPIPEVDLGDFISGVPQGVVLTLMPQTLAIEDDHAMLGGLLVDL